MTPGALREAVKEALGFGIRYSRADALQRLLLGSRRATVVTYHEPAPEVFAAHAALLSNRFNFIPLGLLVDALESGDWSPLPPRPLVVTIDDGHRETFSLLETIRAYRMFPTVFLCSRIVNTNRHFWWKASPGGNGIPRGCSWRDFLESLRRDSGYEPEREYPERQALNADELRAMAPHVDFGSHTRFHPDLPSCDDETCRREIGLAKEELEEMLGVPVDHFAYPGGSFGRREAEFVREAGYRSARSTRPGWNSPRTDPFCLHVTGVQDDATPNILCGQFTGLYPLFKVLIER